MKLLQNIFDIDVVGDFSDDYEIDIFPNEWKIKLNPQCCHV